MEKEKEKKRKRRKKSKKKTQPNNHNNDDDDDNDNKTLNTNNTNSVAEEEEEEEEEDTQITTPPPPNLLHNNNGGGGRDFDHSVHPPCEEQVVELEESRHSLLQENQHLMLHISRLQSQLHNLEITISSTNESHQLNKASLENDIAQLQSDKDLLFQNEVNLEEKLNQLHHDNAILSEKEANMEEKIRQLEGERDSWILAENASKETMSKMNIDITRLRMQVAELEESRSTLVKENQQLMVNVSGFQLQLQNLEMNTSNNESNEANKIASQLEDSNSQLEGAFTLVDKLIAENAELVEKVNELCVKLDRKNVEAGNSSGIECHFVAQNTSMDNSTREPKYDEGNEEEVLISEYKTGPLLVGPSTVVPYPSETESGEIVHIAMEDNRGTGIQDLEVQAIEREEVLLTDAPLIGAPFRLISFVTKYVSGADLVDQ